MNAAVAGHAPSGGRGEAVIDVRDLTKSFGGRVVVDHLALKLHRGEIFGFLGPNGSGKTTSIRMLCGLLTPDAGEGTCLGFDVIRDAQRIKREAGYMTQRFSFWEDLSIRENLEFIARVYEMDRIEQRVDESLTHLGLKGRESQLAGTLSGGWKQRLALAACLMHDPRLLLLDEPTAGVDPKARRDFWEELHRLARLGITIMVSTHYMDEAERCHRLAYIAYGKLLAQGTPAELVEASKLSTWTVSGEGLLELTDELHQLSAAEQVVPFGNAMHVSGSDHGALEAQLQPFFERPGLQWSRDEPRLEDVFIHLLHQAQDNYGQ